MKYKSIKISEELHKKIKIFCIDKNLKLNGFCEMLIADGFLHQHEYSGLKDDKKQ